MDRGQKQDAYADIAEKNHNDCRISFLQDRINGDLNYRK